VSQLQKKEFFPQKKIAVTQIKNAVTCVKNAVMWVKNAVTQKFVSTQNLLQTFLILYFITKP